MSSPRFRATSDYRVEIIELDVATTEGSCGSPDSYPSLSSRAIHALVPLAVVRERTRKRMLLTGFERGASTLRSEAF